MSRTYGSRDIISIVIPKLGDNTSSGIDSLRTSRRHKMVLVELKKISSGVIPFPRSIFLTTKMLSYGSRRKTWKKNMISQRY
jgi:hypothetical protein